MATCSLETLLSDACANGFTCLEPATARAVELQLWHDILGESLTAEELIEQACASGFTCLEPAASKAVRLQLLCDLVSGDSPVIPTAPTADMSSGKVGGNNVGLGFVADAPFLDNWQTAWSLTGTGDPSSDPGEWTLEGTPDTADAGSAEGVRGMSPTEWGAIRYRSGGIWSPWTTMLFT